jgi:hypothetical protein
MADAMMVKRWLAFGFVMFLAACGGGGGGGSSAPAPIVTATPTPTPTATATATATPFNGPSPVSTTTAVPTSGTLSANFPSIAAGYGGSLNAPGVIANAGTSVLATISLGPLPSVTGQPAITNLSASNITQVLVYGDFLLTNPFATPSVSVSQGGAGNTTLTFTFPPGTLVNTPYYYAIWPGNSTNPSWIVTSGTPACPFPVTTADFGAGQTITIVGAPSNNFGNFVYGFAIYRGTLPAGC